MSRSNRPRPSMFEIYRVAQVRRVMRPPPPLREDEAAAKALLALHPVPRCAAWTAPYFGTITLPRLKSPESVFKLPTLAWAIPGRVQFPYGHASAALAARDFQPLAVKLSPTTAAHATAVARAAKAKADRLRIAKARKRDEMPSTGESDDLNAIAVRLLTGDKTLRTPYLKNFVAHMFKCEDKTKIHATFEEFTLLLLDNMDARESAQCGTHAHENAKPPALFVDRETAPKRPGPDRNAVVDTKRRRVFE